MNPPKNEYRVSNKSITDWWFLILWYVSFQLCRPPWPERAAPHPKRRRSWHNPAAGPIRLWTLNVEVLSTQAHKPSSIEHWFLHLQLPWQVLSLTHTQWMASSYSYAPGNFEASVPGRLPGLQTWWQAFTSTTDVCIGVLILVCSPAFVCILAPSLSDLVEHNDQNNSELDQGWWWRQSNFRHIRCYEGVEHKYLHEKINMTLIQPTPVMVGSGRRGGTREPWWRAENEVTLGCWWRSEPLPPARSVGLSGDTVQGGSFDWRVKAHITD